MRLFYTVAYGVGFKPWETAASRESELISAMFDREESGREPPYGRALDLGCGTGMQSVDLAWRRWQVTGVEIVPEALRAARERARQAGVDVRLIQGDIAALRAAGVGSGFRFVLDFGRFHGLKDAQRLAVGREVTAVTVLGATMLMIAWAPGRRGPLPRGATGADIEAAFPSWTTIGEDSIPNICAARAAKTCRPPLLPIASELRVLRRSPHPWSRSCWTPSQAYSSSFSPSSSGRSPPNNATTP